MLKKLELGKLFNLYVKKMETTQIVYAYSLKQGIEDGYLTPYRVKICKNKILDEYQYNPDDKIIQGEELLDKDKIYTEKDLYKGDIKIRQRDEDRVFVKDLLISALYVVSIRAFALQRYAKNAVNIHVFVYRSLALFVENLPELIKLKYGTINDAKTELGSLGEINKVFVDFQKSLYAA